jgi:hypothetical protein
MGRRGNPGGDARAEGFMKTLGHEEVHRNGHGTSADAVARLPRFPDGAYNARRLHPAPGQVRPVRFEEINARAAA